VGMAGLKGPQEDTFEPVLAQTTFHGTPSRSRRRLRPLPNCPRLLQIQVDRLASPLNNFQ
jgi:hypothetical protein